MSVCRAAQSEPRVEVVFLPPVVSLGLCMCARLGQPGAIGGGLGSGGRKDEARERDGGMGGQQGSRRERCRSGKVANREGGEERWMVR